MAGRTVTGSPYSKDAQLARGERRYRRKVASAKQWQAIIAAKLGPCRCCGSAATNGKLYGRIELHHVVPRDRHGDDLADNIVPLCPDCHAAITAGNMLVGSQLVAALEPAEITYAVGKLGDDGIARLYGCPPPAREAWPA